MKSIAIRSTAPPEYLKEDGTGYFQTSFQTNCPHPSCTKKITKQHLRARKFALHIIRNQGGPTNSLPYVHLPLSFVVVWFRLTIYTHNGRMFRGIARYTGQPSRDEKINTRIRSRFLDPQSVKDFLSVPGVEEELCKKILEESDYSLPKLRAKAGRSPA
jgi:hypothetical protein